MPKSSLRGFEYSVTITDDFIHVTSVDFSLVFRKEEFKFSAPTDAQCFENSVDMPNSMAFIFEYETVVNSWKYHKAKDNPDIAEELSLFCQLACIAIISKFDALITCCR